MDGKSPDILEALVLAWDYNQLTFSCACLFLGIVVIDWMLFECYNVNCKILLKEIGYMMARAIYESYGEEAEIYCGIGGMHYSSKFTKMAINEGLAFGHIASKYRFASLTPDSLNEMFQKSTGAQGFLIENKSFDSLQKNSLKKMLDSKSLNYRFV